MAGRKKKSDKADAETPEETPAESVTEAPEDAPAKNADDAPAEDIAESAAEQAEPEDETTAPEDTAETGESPPEDVASEQPPHEQEPATQAIVPVAEPEPAASQNGAFFTLLLGGVAAAVVGFAVARFVFPDNWPSGGDQTGVISAELKKQTAALTALEQRMAAFDALQAGLSDHEASIGALADRMNALEAQVTQIAERPAGDGVSGAALSAYETQLNALRAELDSQRETIEAMNANAASLEANAGAAAQDALRRAALTRIQSALDAGTSYAAALADLEGTGVSVPETLKATASGGVASMADLMDTFPDAARAALFASRGATGNEGGFSAFLRSQMGARSLAPREGNDPDAILSRVEAAAKDGRLTDALAELDALPEEGRAELADWADRAAERLAAVSAMQQLSDELN